MNKIKEVLNSMAVIFLYFLWPYVISIFTSLLKANDSAVIIIKFFASFILLFIILFIYRKTFIKGFKNFINDFKEKYVKIIGAFVVGLISYFVLKTIILMIFPNIVFEDITGLNSAFASASGLLIISTLFYYPVIEEFVYKRTFKELIANKWFFIVITALFNSVFQVIFMASEPLTLVTILPNFVFYASMSYIYYETDNILFPISLRMMYNLIPNIIQFLFIF